MALPKPQLSIFSLTIPSTKKTIKYRQFTVKEENLLAQAEQSEDTQVILNAIVGIIEVCCQDIGDVNDLALFDIEYIMTRIRSKSVGESIDLQMSCDADASHNKIPVRISLEDIEVVFPEGHEKKIELYEKVGVVMKYPSFGQIPEFEQMDELQTIAACIDFIYTDEEVFYAKEQTKEELIEFLEGLTKTQLAKIQDNFFKKLPSYEHTIKYQCAVCGHQHEKLIKGIGSFFL